MKIFQNFSVAMLPHNLKLDFHLRWLEGCLSWQCNIYGCVINNLKNNELFIVFYSLESMIILEIFVTSLLPWYLRYVMVNLYYFFNISFGLASRHDFPDQTTNYNYATAILSKYCLFIYLSTSQCYLFSNALSWCNLVIKCYYVRQNVFGETKS